MTSGRYIAYVHLHAVPATLEVPGRVEVLDLKRGVRLGKYAAAAESRQLDRHEILLRPTGAVAGIGEVTGNAAISYSVETARAGEHRAVRVDSGPRVRPIAVTFGQVASAGPTTGPAGPPRSAARRTATRTPSRPSPSRGPRRSACRRCVMQNWSQA